MKKVLMVAYSFPPTGGPGVQRSLKFVKYLRNFGWEPVVLTRDIKNMKLKDESLNKDIPEGISITRTNPWELTELEGFLGLAGKFISRKVLIPDGERLWEIFAKSSAVRIIRNDKIDLIYTTSVPYSAHLMGLYLKRKFPDIPWVADFRDEWTNNPYLLDNPHNAVRMNIERRMERKVLINADCLITNTPVMLSNFIENNPDLGLKDKFFCIPNGYDRDDFKIIDTIKPGNKRFTITYTGAFYGRRKPDTFFEALYELIRDGKVDESRVHGKFIGNFKLPQLNKQLEKYGLERIVEIFSYMDHDECIKHMLQSDALLLIEGGGHGSEAFYTGKVFEYMVTNRPIIAVVPKNGAAAQVIRQTRTGLVSDFDDVKQTKENILTFYNSWLNNESSFSPNYEEIGKYDRKVLTGELVKVFSRAMKL